MKMRKIDPNTPLKELIENNKLVIIYKKINGKTVKAFEVTSNKEYDIKTGIIIPKEDDYLKKECEKLWKKHNLPDPEKINFLGKLSKIPIIAKYQEYLDDIVNLIKKKDQTSSCKKISNDITLKEAVERFGEEEIKKIVLKKFRY